MRLLAIVVILVVPALDGARMHAAGPPQFCVPPPVRTTPRQPYERVDKWQRDQRTIA